MNHLYKYITAIILCLSLNPITGLMAQDDAELIELAHEMYNFGDKQGAMEIYLQALEINPDKPISNLMAGICYLATVDKAKAIPLLEKIYPVEQQVVEELFYFVEFPDHVYDLWEETQYILYLIGEAYQFDYQFDTAIVYYQRYKQDIVDREVKRKKGYKENTLELLLKKIDRRIFECNNGKEFVEFPIGVIIQNVGKDVNSLYSEYVPLVSADQSLLIFTSRRAGSTGGNMYIDNQYYEDIYISNKDGHRWTPAHNIGSNINTDLHDACIGLSPDGSQLFVYNTSNGGDIYMSTLDDNNWTVPKSFNKPINSKFLEASASVTADGNTLYFTSTRPYYKDLDIYKSVKDEYGVWSEPVNLGTTVNTEYDDDAPFILSDNKTLTFSSKGHKGMGGYDIFRTTLSEFGTWSEPVNMGFPINTTGDDVYMVFSGDGSTGYFSSVRETGFGDQDIYKVTLPRMMSVSQSGEEGGLLDYISTYDVKKKKSLDSKVLKEVLAVAPQTKISNLPAEFREADLDRDNYISTEEIFNIIDAFFEDETDFTVDRIYALIDYFFEQ